MKKIFFSFVQFFFKKKKFIRFKNLRKMEDWNLSISFLKSNENEFEFYYLQISDE